MQKTAILFSICIFQFFFYSIHGQENELLNRLHNHVTILASDSLEGRGLGTGTMEQTRDYIVSEFKKTGIKPFKGSYLYPFSFRVGLVRVEGKNIIGIIEGNDPELKHEYIVLGAHYDHLGWKNKNGEKIIFNGADDNASGTAGIIEMARILNSGKELKRSILFIAFDAEESGLIGSKKIIQDSVLSSSEVKFMFSFDMIGMYEANKGVELHGMELLENAKRIVDETLQDNDIKITKINPEIIKNTDTYIFGINGIPAVHVFTGTKSPYHKPEDDSHLLDYEGMAKVVKFSADLTQNLANEEKLIATVNSSEGDGERRIKFGIRANIGTTSHNYIDDFFTAKPVFSSQVGFYTQLRMSKLISLQPEVLYAYEGSQHALGNIRTQAVIVPANIVFGTPDTEVGRVYGILGVYYKYNFSGNIDGTGIEFNDDYKEESWGINYGFGVQVKNIQIGFFIKNGLSDVEMGGIDGKVVEKGAFLSLGMNF